MGSYIDNSKVAAVTQFSDGVSTSPTTAQITQWITEVEADADARALGSYTLTDELVDVLPGQNYPDVDSIAWLQALSHDHFSYYGLGNLIVIPPFTPIISIASLSRRVSMLGSSDSYESLTEGTSSGTSYIILKKRTKTNKFLGFALFFHHNNPFPGYQKIKMTYNYGWNLDTNIIGEWCTLKVALKVFNALQEAETPTASQQYAIENTNISLNLDARVKLVKDRIEEIENKYFPQKELGIALI